MPVIKVYGLDGGVGRIALRGLIGDVQGMVAGVPSLNIAESEVVVLFPSDLYTDDAGECLIAEVCGIFRRPERTAQVFAKLREAICASLARFANVHLPMCKSMEVAIAYTMEPSELTFYERDSTGGYTRREFT